MDSKQYEQYLLGCRLLGQEPVSEDEFAQRWQEFETHAEKLRLAEESGKPPEVDAELRREMQRRVKEDLFVRAILIGQSESEG